MRTPPEAAKPIDQSGAGAVNGYNPSDGSVRTITDDIHLKLWRSISTCDRGEVVQLQ